MLCANNIKLTIVHFMIFLGLGNEPPWLSFENTHFERIFWSILSHIGFKKYNIIYDKIYVVFLIF